MAIHNVLEIIIRRDDYCVPWTLLYWVRFCVVLFILRAYIYPFLCISSLPFVCFSLSPSLRLWSLQSFLCKHFFPDSFIINIFFLFDYTIATNSLQADKKQSIFRSACEVLYYCYQKTFEIFAFQLFFIAFLPNHLVSICVCLFYSMLLPLFLSLSCSQICINRIFIYTIDNL